LSESTLASAWDRLRAARRPGLIPYLTAGHPTPAQSLAALRAADEVADIVEVGVPFSDPLADGPTIQRSTYEALQQGMTLPGTLDLIARAQLQRPVVVFSYLNPILRYGVGRFLEDAAALGVAGLLLTDLPAGSDPEIETLIQASPIDLIRLVAPTTRRERIVEAVRGAQGFIYLIARLGVTGATPRLSADLAETVARVRAATPLPIAVGFGISTPEQAAAVGRVADGVVIGSALVDILGRQGVGAAEDFLRRVRAALDRSEAAR
jgi:tryptophan synthase alpha chain